VEAVHLDSDHPFLEVPHDLAAAVSSVHVQLFRPEVELVFDRRIAERLEALLERDRSDPPTHAGVAGLDFHFAAPLQVHVGADGIGSDRQGLAGRAACRDKHQRQQPA
jgi:hypothetical protein